METNKASRNFFWDNYVRRLGAIINTINEDKKNWEVKGRWGKDEKGDKDYIYEVVRKPFIPKMVYDKERNCMVIINEPKQESVW